MHAALQSKRVVQSSANWPRKYIASWM